MPHSNALIAKVSARNKVNAEINRIRPLLIEALTPFLGKKILNTGNVLSEKCKKIVDPIFAASTARWYQGRSQYSLYFSVYVDERYAHGGYDSNIRVEDTLYLGEISDNNLRAFTDFQPRITDFTADAVEYLRQAARQAKKLADAAESRLYPFGFSDQ